jgi:hypothetical protein
LNDVRWILALQSRLDTMAAFRVPFVAFDPSVLVSERMYTHIHTPALDLLQKYLFLQLKQPRRDLVCPFLGIGLRGSGGAPPFPPSDKVGESLEELSTTPPRS